MKKGNLLLMTRYGSEILRFRIEIVGKDVLDLSMPYYEVRLRKGTGD